MKRRIPPHEFVTLMAYDTIDPFGETRADLRMGIMTANIVNAVCAAVGHNAKKVPSDFMPFKAPRRKQTLEEMKAIPSLFRKA